MVIMVTNIGHREWGLGGMRVTLDGEELDEGPWGASEVGRMGPDLLAGEIRFEGGSEAGGGVDRVVLQDDLN